MIGENVIMKKSLVVLCCLLMASASVFSVEQGPGEEVVEHKQNHFSHDVKENAKQLKAGSGKEFANTVRQKAKSVANHLGMHKSGEHRPDGEHKPDGDFRPEMPEKPEIPDRPERPEIPEMPGRN